MAAAAHRALDRSMADDRRQVVTLFIGPMADDRWQMTDDRWPRQLVELSIDRWQMTGVRS